jgi:hypothetical protein
MSRLLAGLGIVLGMTVISTGSAFAHGCHHSWQQGGSQGWHRHGSKCEPRHGIGITKKREKRRPQTRAG